MACILNGASEKCCFSNRVLCCLGLTLLLHLFLQGEGRELHCAPPITELGFSGAPRLALRVNKLYPEILSPPPQSFSHHSFYFLASFFDHLLFLFFHTLLVLFRCYLSQLFSSSLHPLSHHPSLYPSYPQVPVKTSSH